MPVKIITTGLPQVRVEDSGTPLTEGLSRASETLLNLGPQLARINMEKAHYGARMGLEQQRVALEQERVRQAEQRAQEYGQWHNEENKINAQRYADQALHQRTQDTTNNQRYTEQTALNRQIAAGRGLAPPEEQYAPGILGMVGRGLHNGLGMNIPSFAQSPEMQNYQEQREANLGKTAAQTTDILGRNPMRQQVAEIGAGAKTEATHARENTALTSLIQRESDAAVKAALKQKKMAAMSDPNADFMTISLTPEEEQAVRASAEHGVRAIHGQPMGVMAPQQAGPPPSRVNLGNYKLP